MQGELGTALLHDLRVGSQRANQSVLEPELFASATEKDYLWHCLHDEGAFAQGVATQKNRRMLRDAQRSFLKYRKKGRALHKPTCLAPDVW